MPRTRAQVTQADIARAIRAMRAAGYADVRVVFREGSVIVEANPGDADPKPSRLDRGRLIVL